MSVCVPSVICELAISNSELSDAFQQLKGIATINGYRDGFYIILPVADYPGQNPNAQHVYSIFNPNSQVDEDLSPILEKCINNTIIGKYRVIIWEVGDEATTNRNRNIDTRSESDCGIIFPIKANLSSIGFFLFKYKFSSKDLVVKIKSHFDDMYINALRVHVMGSIKLISNYSNGDDVELTSHEKVVLAWAAKGKTNWEIGKILDRSTSTINHHMRQAVAKLNAANKCEAVAKALNGHLI